VQDIYEQDKATLSLVTNTKATGNPNPTPVSTKAVHAGMVYNPSLSSKNGEEMYTPPEYNLSVIANCLDTDSYFRRAVEKYVELIWKAGYSFYGKNPNAVAYVRKRFEQIGEVTANPTDQLFRDISYQLVEYSNVYVSKVRNMKASGGKERRTFTGQLLTPVAGYFIEDSVSMQLAVKENGDPIGYKQCIPGSREWKIWRPWNMIHMVHSRKPGLRVGTPMVWPVLDDIRALRRIEQNVELLIFQHTIPLFQYIVGTENRPAQPDEIVSVKQTVERMPPNGCVVTPERHEIKAIGLEGSAIDVSTYLDYYKNRVLSGLGMSGVGMGEGCHDEKTETLTEHGWKKINEIGLTDRIATCNPISRKIEYHIPNERFVARYTGEMVCMNTKHVNFKVTPNHEMWICNDPKINTWKKIKAEELIGHGPENFSFLEKTEGKINSDINEFITINNIPYTCKNTKQLKFQPLIFNKKYFSEFLGYFVSEGSLETSNHKFRIILTQKKEDILQKMIECLEKLSINYSKSIDKGGCTNISIYHKSLYIYLLNECGKGCYNKKAPKFLKNESDEIINMFLEAAIDGDGTRCKKKGSSHSTYYTTSEQLADDIQELSILVGRTAKKKKYYHNEDKKGIGYIYRIFISNRNSIFRHVKRKDLYREYYHGYIYCFNVPNHLFLTRREGKVTIQGNSTSNKGTAIVLDKHLVNSCGMFQQVFKMNVDEFMIKELLAEGGFDTSYINEDNKVGILFPPIDTEEQRAKENHYAQMYTQHAVNEDEMRKEFGMEPMQDGERDKDYFELILKPLEMIKAKLAQETAIIAGQAKPVVTKSLSGASKVHRPNKVGAAKERPTNQHGQLGAKPRIPKNDEVEQLLDIFKDTKNDLIDSCIDAVKEDVPLLTKLTGIRKYNFENSKSIIEKKKAESTLEDKEALYGTAIRTLDELYDRFSKIQDMKHVDDLTVRISSLFSTLSVRIEGYYVDDVEDTISDLNSDS